MKTYLALQRGRVALAQAEGPDERPRLYGLKKMKGHELRDEGARLFLYNALSRNILAEKRRKVDKKKREARNVIGLTTPHVHYSMRRTKMRR